MKRYPLALAVAIGLLPVAPASAQTPGASAASTFSVPSVEPGAVLSTAGAPAEQAGQAPTPEPAKASDQEKPKNGWNVWENKAFATTLILTFGVDVAEFVQDDANTEQVGPQPTLVKWRAERINLVGQIKFKRPWTYQFGGNFNGLEADRGERWTWMDARLDIPVPKVGRVRIGRQKVGVDHEWVMALTDWVFMERSVSSAFVPQRNVGVLVENSAAGDRVVWSAGWFNDWFANDNSFSDNGNQYTARISALPVDAGPQGDTVVQVGASVFYKEAKNGKLQYRSRPEINQSDYFADTGKFTADHAVTPQFESMVIKGRWQVFADGSLTPVSAAQAGNPLFFGGFAGVGYFLTQDHHGFNRREGYVGRFTPRSPFSLHGGGRGAWEVGGRYSYVDLTNGTIDGGTMSRWTGVLSWYPTREWRLEFNYGYITLERGGTTGYAHGLSSRVVWNM